MSENYEDSNQYVALDEQMYQVERIMGKRYVSGKVMYLVKWFQWDRPEDLTWQPLQNLKTVPDLIKAYQQQQQTKSHKNTKSERRAQTLEKSQDKNQPKPKKKLKKQSQKIFQQKSRKQKQASIQESQEKQQKQERKKQKHYVSIQSNSQESSSVRLAKQRRQKIENEGGRKKSEMNKKNSLKIGCVNHLIIKQNKVFYEVDIINQKQQCIGVMLMPSSQVREGNKKQLIACLQRHLEDYQRYKDYIA